MELRQLKKGTYFRTINSKGIVSRETYLKGDYDASERKYLCEKASDVWGFGKYFKGDKEVTTEFEF